MEDVTVGWVYKAYGGYKKCELDFDRMPLRK
jgi:hypothetical protein